MPKYLFLLACVVSSICVGVYSGEVWAQVPCVNASCSTQWDGTPVGKYSGSPKQPCSQLPCLPNGVPTYCRREKCNSCGACASAATSQCPVSPDACSLPTAVLCQNTCGC